MHSKIIRHFCKTISFTLHFGIIIAAKLLILPYLSNKKSLYNRNKDKHGIIKNYLKRKYRNTINGFKTKRTETDPSLADNYQVWTIWWQGEDEMPPIVKSCYKSLIKHSNGHKINLLTKDNYKSFVQLPDFILKRFEEKQLSITHLSDVLRVCLLYEHGGLWLDSTVLLTSSLPSLPQICSHMGFWTPKDDGNILETCFGARNWIVRENKWLTFCFYTGKNSILTEFVREMFFSYIKSHAIFIDYFLFDYFISIAYDTLQEIRVMIDSVPENNPKVHEIYHRLNLGNEYNKTLFDNVCIDTSFHKLNWKDEYTLFTKSGKLTNYGFIIKNSSENYLSSFLTKVVSE